MTGINSTDAQGNANPVFTMPIETITANRTLTAADSGKAFLVATDGLTITLPATAKGLVYTFLNAGAAGANSVTIAPVAADGIAGTITLAATVVARPGTVNTPIVNTKATTKTGDCLYITGTGLTGTAAWLIQTSTGIWA